MVKFVSFNVNDDYNEMRHLLCLYHLKENILQMAGSVIGKGGQNIQKIRSEFSAQVNF